MKGLWASLQETIYLLFICKLMEGLLQLSALSSSVSIVFVKLIIFSRIIGLWCPGHGMRLLQHGLSFTSISMLLVFEVKRESLTLILGLWLPLLVFPSPWALAFLEGSVVSIQISVTRMKSVAFLRVSAKEASFY